MDQPLPTSSLVAPRAPEPSLRQGARTQLKVIGALIMRELHTRYGRDNVGYLWLILEPMLLATAIAVLHSRASNHFTSDIKAVPLTLVGYCNFMIFRGVVNRSEGALEANTPLLHHRTVTIFDVLASRAVLEWAGCSLSLAVLLGLTISLGISELPVRPLFLVLGSFSMLLLSFGLAMIICAGTYENRSLGRLIHPMTYILLPLSGAFIRMEWIPEPFRTYVGYIPMTHVFEMLRHGQFRSATLEYADFYYLGAWILGSWLLGLLAISAVKKHVQLS